jgi:hypothetical protein
LILLALDISTHTGWAVFNDKKLLDYGVLNIKIDDLNFKPDPSKSPKYPKNILNASSGMLYLIKELLDKYSPKIVICENTTKGRNRHYQRCLEWFHKDIIDYFVDHEQAFVYMDPSEWRFILDMRLSKDDKKNNREVSLGKKRGRITKKHLSVRMANNLFSLNLKIKDNDIADALMLCWAYINKYENRS